MRRLKNLSVKDRIKLIHSWFPEEILSVLDFTKIKLSEFLNEKPEMLSRWVAGTWSAEKERDNLREAIEMIEEHNTELFASRKLFAEQLYSGYLSCYTVFCLIEYAKKNKHANRKGSKEFFLAVDLFFNISITDESFEN